jgi:cytochrome P450
MQSDDRVDLMNVDPLPARLSSPAPLDPPLARPGNQSLPVIGPVLAGLATAAGPLEQALRCRAESGDVFTVDLPGNAPITYVLGARGYAFMNRLPAEIAGIGDVLQIVSVFSRWISRADPSPAYLELLALSGRAFLQHRLRRAEATTGLRELVEGVAADHSRSWSGDLDLADAIVNLVHSASMRCVAGAPVWTRLRQRGLPLLRTMAASIDVPRLALGGTPARFLMREYWAARRFERVLRDLIAAHDSEGGIELIDDLRGSMRVDGRPLDERDLPWALNYVLFNACAYPGTYGFWSFVDLIAAEGAQEEIRASADDAALRRAEHAVLETIRLNPVTVAGRMLKQEVRYPIHGDAGAGEYVIRKGGMLGSAPGSYTRDPNVHRDPDGYCPHRFARGEPVPQLFGGGPFGCVAQRYVRALLPAVHTYLLRHFDVRLRAPLPPRRARPALHYPDRRVMASVVRVTS